jgi:Beta-glucanase/Beta-glucan synthetase
MEKMFYFLLFLLLFSSDTFVAKGQNADGIGWKLVFSDEFNQKNGSQPDSTKWSRHNRYKGTWSRWISNSSKVVFIRNGSLVCRAIPNQTEPGDTARMLTGAINTRGKFEFQYGKVEVRMKTNRKQGNFPAAWLAKNNHFDQYGEIDIIESFGDKVSAAHAIHSRLTYNQTNHGQKNSFKSMDVDATKWHVYGIIWTEKDVKWQIDGKTVAYFEKTKDKSLLNKGQWTFDYPFFIILNQSVGNGEYGNKGDTSQTYETRFDWIRVYQRANSIGMSPNSAAILE